MSGSLGSQVAAALAAMDFPNGNDAPNSSGCPNGNGSAPLPIRQAQAEGRMIYNIAESSISPSAPIAVPPTTPPTHTMLNPVLYPR